MIVRRPRITVLLLAFALGMAVAGLAACGGGGTNKALIPASDAGPLNDDFDAVALAVDDGDCTGATNALVKAQSHLDQLPGRVSVRLRRRLQEGINTLKTQAARECEENQQTTATQTTTTATTTTTTPTVPPTTPTVPPTTPTVPPTTPTTPPPTTPPDDTGGVEIP